jgi:hypothetical protein
MNCSDNTEPHTQTAPKRPDVSAVLVREAGLCLFSRSWALRPEMTPSPNG